MTTETFAAVAPYTIAGTGPYAIGHDYTDGAIRAAVVLGESEAELVADVDFTVSPAAGDSGNLTLAAGVASTWAGGTLTITRETTLEQGFAGQTAREIAVEAQLDRNVQALQEAIWRLDGHDVRLDGHDAELLEVGEQIEELTEIAEDAVNGLAAAQAAAATAVAAAEIAVDAANAAVATTLQPVVYGSRALAEAAEVPAEFEAIRVIHAGEVLDYVKDASGAALTTADGADWSPASVRTVKHYGAVGDGATDDSAAIQAALDDADGERLVFNAGGSYLVETGLTVTDQAISIKGYRATLVQGADVIPLHVSASAVNVTAATSIDNTDTADLSDGDGVTTPVASILFASHSFAVGDVLKVVSDSAFPEAGSTDFRWGEVARVAAITANEVFLSRRLITELPGSPTVLRAAQLQTFGVEIHGLRFDTLAAGDAGGWTAHLLKLEGLVAPRLRDLHFVKGHGIALEVQGCVEIDAADISGGNLTHEPGADRYAYLVNDVSGTANSWSRLSGERCRHVYTTNINAVSAGGDVRLFGQTVGCVVNDGKSLDCYGAGFDTHHDAHGITFNDCHAVAAVRGKGAIGAGFQVRGQHVTLNNCTAFGTKWGAQVLQQYNTLATGKAVINGFKSRTPFAGILLSGVSGYPLAGIRISDVNVETWDHTHVIEGSYCACEIEDSRLRHVGANDDSRLVQADAGAAFAVYDTTFDLTLHTGSNPYLGGLGADDSWMRFDKVDVSGTWRGIFEFNGADGSGITRSPVRCSSAPTNAGAIGGSGGTPEIGVDYVVGDGETTAFAYLPLTYSTTGNKDLDLGFRSCAHIFVRPTVSAAGVAINTITDGLFLGQKLSICNYNASANSIDVNHNTGGNITLAGSAVTLAAGEAMGLWWDGGTWRRDG